MQTTEAPSLGNTSTQPEADPLLQWKAAERAQRRVVIQHQIALVKSRVNLGSMKGTEEVQEALHAIVREFPRGVSFGVVKSTFDPSVNLVPARDELLKEGKLKTDDKKRSMMLYPVEEKKEDQGS